MAVSCAWQRVTAVVCPVDVADAEADTEAGRVAVERVVGAIVE